MSGTPETTELLEAVRGFLNEARERLDGRHAFHALVAANVVDIVRRELSLGADAEAGEAARLASLLGRDGSRDELLRALCAAIRTGDIAFDDPVLIDHLERTTLDRLAIDQPGYSGVRIATEARDD